MRNGYSIKGQTLFAVILIALMNLFLFADQNLMAPNLTQIARDFGFNDVQRDVMLGGNISLVFWFLGATIALLIGYLTDKFSRKWLFIAVILVGTVPCMLTGFTTTYDQFFWMRALTGIGIGGAVPITYSFIGDYFPHKNRTIGVMIIGLATGLGIAFGQILAGTIGPVYGWRLPFIIVAIPNLFLVFLFLFTVKEPLRGGAEESLHALIETGKKYTERINWQTLKGLFNNKTTIFAILQCIPGSIPWGVFFVYLNDFYAQDKGYSIQIATLIVMTVGAATIIGGLIGGLLGNKLYSINPKYQPLLSAMSTLLGIIPAAFLINYPSQVGTANPDFVPPIVIGFIAGIVVSLCVPNTRTMLLNVNPPESHGTVFALFNLVDDLGKGFGPAVISLLIVAFGRLVAFNLANLIWVFSGLLLLVTVWTYTKDESRLKAMLAKRAEEI